MLARKKFHNSYKILYLSVSLPHHVSYMSSLVTRFTTKITWTMKGKADVTTVPLLQWIQSFKSSPDKTPQFLQNLIPFSISSKAAISVYPIYPFLTSSLRGLMQKSTLLFKMLLTMQPATLCMCKTHLLLSASSTPISPLLLTYQYNIVTLKSVLEFSGITLKSFNNPE